MTHCNIVAAVALIAALICAPSVAAASPPAPQCVAQAQPWLDWANSFVVPGTASGQHARVLPPAGHATKNEVSIETIESPARFAGDAYDNEMGLRSFWSLPDVDDEVL